MCTILKKGPDVSDDDDVPGDSIEDIEACRFDFKITDSDYDLATQVCGRCPGMYEEECGEFRGEWEGEGYEKPDPCGQKKKKSIPPIPSYFDKEFNPVYDPPARTPSQLLYTGVELASSTPKKTRADYPTDLRLTKVCAPKPPRRLRTIDTSKNQPIAKFSPVSSEIRLAKKDSLTKLLEESESVDVLPRKLNEKQLLQKERPECQKMSRDPPPIVSLSDEVVVGFLMDNNIQMLFEYFLGHCLLKMPEDPFQFIADLTEKLMKGRKSDSAFKEIPRLLTTKHVEAMFRMFDRVGSGKISFFQYTNAMESMGLVKFNQTPGGWETDEITQDTFVAEGIKGIDDLLRSFIFKRVEPTPRCY